MRSMITDEVEEALNQAQQEMFVRSIPMLIIFEGSSGRVVSRVINELNRCLEPRGIAYYHFDPARPRGPKAVADFLAGTPAPGAISLYDRSWYASLIHRYQGDENELAHDLGVICRFENYLMDSGTFLIKVCLTADTADLAKYAADYRATTAMNGTFLSVDHVDRVKAAAVFPLVRNGTDTDRCPWTVVKVGPVKDTVEAVADAVLKRFAVCLKDDSWQQPSSPFKYIRCSNPRKDLDLDGSAAGYDQKMEEYSDELTRLQILLAVSGCTLIIGFEGWDAAGKGSCIKHLCHALNPRGYRVHGIKAPTPEESAHSYLWRFAGAMPEPGHIAIFDRTWYGRMMVEPIEGFCTQEEYARAPGEINGFEHMLTDAGAIIVKFWLDISQDTQLARFNDRKDDPLKQWKLTDEDWRNRDKWEEYDRYVNVMMESTNTPEAPWTAVPANNKKAAHLVVLGTVVDALRRALEP